MCKLCNLTPKRDDNGTLRKAPVKNPTQQLEFVEIVNDYTGENPCSKCITSYRISTKLQSIDEYIMGRLKRRYSNASSKELARVRWAMRQKFSDTSRECVKTYARETYTRVKVEKNIHKKINTKINSEYFIVQIRINSKSFAKTMKTLGEAQQYKERVLNEHKYIKN